MKTLSKISLLPLLLLFWASQLAACGALFRTSCISHHENRCGEPEEVVVIAKPYPMPPAAVVTPLSTDVEVPASSVDAHGIPLLGMSPSIAYATTDCGSDREECVIRDRAILTSEEEENVHRALVEMRRAQTDEDHSDSASWVLSPLRVLGPHLYVRAEQESGGAAITWVVLVRCTQGLASVILNPAADSFASEANACSVVGRFAPAR